ncbi:transcriptional regulator TbsP [Halococcus sp. AFM35]|uniref:transcriptional regulator TbsP n=1 Tax=Halococcus sp. AFM35 TaxID=3421653 RepID=UPI003EC08F18
MDGTTQSTVIERNAADLWRAVLEDDSDTVLAVGLSTDVIDGLLEALRERDDTPSIRVLAAETVLKDLVSDFTVAGTIADFVAEDVLSLRTTENRLDGPLVVTEKKVITIVPTDAQAAGIGTDDEEFVENARRHYVDRWENAEPFTLRTPPLSRVRETLETELGPEVTDDFEQIRTTLQTTRDNDHSGLDGVDLCLLAAAKSGALLYDISTWGESVGLASRATFSRKKTAFEEMGLIETEKVPIDVGRPRQRLVLGDERLQGVDADELVGVVGSITPVTGS